MNARFHASRVGQGICVVTGEREAHAQTAEDLREALSAAVAGGCKRVLVDLQESEHVDPLVLAQSSAASAGYRTSAERWPCSARITAASPTSRGSTSTAR